MNRTSRSAVRRWHETRRLNQCSAPESTSMPSLNPSACSAFSVIAQISA